MFAALKESAAKRKLARKAATEKYHARIAEINQKRDIELALIQVEREANKAAFSAKIKENNRILAEAWSK